MSRDADLKAIANCAEVSLAELGDLQRGVSLRILHRWGNTSGCAPGEEVWAALLIYHGREFPLPLSLAPLLLLDQLARTRHIPQLASQIVAGLRKSEFVRRHGANAGAIRTRRYSRSTIKEYVKRIRQSLASVFIEACLPMRAERVLCSEETDGNETRYRLRAQIEWIHLRSETRQR